MPPKPHPGAMQCSSKPVSASAADQRARRRKAPRGLRLPAALALGIVGPLTRVLGTDASGVVEAVGADGSHPATR